MGPVCGFDKCEVTIGHSFDELATVAATQKEITGGIKTNRFWVTDAIAHLHTRRLVQIDYLHDHATTSQLHHLVAGRYV